MFNLHKRLRADTFEVCQLQLCKVLLMNDTAYPWLILVPAQNDIVELTDLKKTDQQLLMSEIVQVSEVLKSLTDADKMNVATLGNMVPQLHVHVIARFKDDAAWPAPIWGKTQPIPYTDVIKGKLISALQEKLA